MTWQIVLSKTNQFNDQQTGLLKENCWINLTVYMAWQVSFAKRASVEPEPRTVHNLHKMSSLLGGALFIADDYFPETPYIHAAWHLAAAIGIGTCNKLLG